jgi:hypothetical protein
MFTKTGSSARETRIMNMPDHTVPVAEGTEDSLMKRCTVCGAVIVWKRWLARDWRELKYCGAVCRRKAVTSARAGLKGPSL